MYFARLSSFKKVIKRCFILMLASMFVGINLTSSVYAGSFYDSMQKKFIDRGINVRWYGAKGDGVTDDTQAFVKVFNEVKRAGGGEIYIPKTSKKYVINSNFSVSNINNVIVWGNGSIIEFKHYKNAFINCTNIQFSGIEIQGGLIYTPVISSVASGSSTVTVKDNVFKVGDIAYNSGLIGKDLKDLMPKVTKVNPVSGGYQLILDRPWINAYDYNGRGDFYIINGAEFSYNLWFENSSDITFKNVVFRRNKGYAVGFKYAKDIVFDGVTIIENGLDQVGFLDGCENIKILNSKFYKNIDWAKQGLVFMPVSAKGASRIDQRIKNVVIDNSTFDEIRDSAIWIAAGENFTITNSKFTRVRIASLNIDYGVNIRVENCTFDGQYSKSKIEGDYKISGEYAVILAYEYMDEAFKPYSSFKNISFTNSRFTDFYKNVIQVKPIKSSTGKDIQKAAGIKNDGLIIDNCYFNETPNAAYPSIGLQTIELRDVNNIRITNSIFEKFYSSVTSYNIKVLNFVFCNGVTFIGNKVNGGSGGKDANETVLLYIYSSNALVTNNEFNNNTGKAVADGFLGVKPLDTGQKNSLVFGNVENTPIGDFFVGVNNNYAVGTQYAGWGGTAQGKIGKNIILYMDKPPLSGTFKTGDLVLITNPKDGGYIGYICIQGGTPGVWKGIKRDI